MKTVNIILNNLTVDLVVLTISYYTQNPNIGLVDMKGNREPNTNTNL